MRYLRLFETLNLKSKISIVKEYYKFIEEIKPVVLFLYKEKASKNPDIVITMYRIGGRLVDLDDYGYVEIDSAHMNNENSLRFTIKIYEDDAEYNRGEGEYIYLFVTVEELERAYLEMDAKRYNL